MRASFLLPILLLLALAACAPSETDDAGATDTDAPEGETISVSVADFMIDPSQVEASGPTVSFAVINDGPTPHNFSVRDEAGEVVLATEDLSVGESETISGDLEPGEYTIFCSLSGHESLGMSGTLTVTESGS